ncbi:PREDICTED: IQ and AAA domain-containing protein 1-like [Amphimedon queenslandica]|uniref:Uncharacterized protein n=1 Tax=Amphimedon queenslandica TaxID=400682 RepID=A0AAN0J8J9_AMPQE|nr:PREDICTED: IQ and AAA domain-containing protein 1-like [Amphimedon queenslandica]|eukprot:XP_019853334.1 PREDICTED: IQ and AAA domain-containing protein 1-like [Amphimedon queenslandica]
MSSLAKVSDGYTPGHMITAITQVLTERRIQQLRKHPLTTAEFIPFLIRFIEKKRKHTKLGLKMNTPLGKKKAKAIKEAM